jgi:hypothetical protein
LTSVTSSSLARTVRTRLGNGFLGRDEPGSLESVADPTPARTDVELFAYGEDCIVSGSLQLDGDRLSDALNLHDWFELRAGVVTDLADGTVHELREIRVLRDDLLVACATGPRGRAERRHRTRQHPVVVKIGPYEVRGYLHALPGAEPLASLRGRPAMVALTDATIRYSSSRGAQLRSVAGVLFNRFLADSIAADADDPRADLAVSST